MGTGYVRNDSGNNIADGNVINASDLDGEFDAIAATLATGGHTHDGTAAEGGPITKLGPSQDLVVTASLVNPKTDNTLDLGTASLEFKDLFIDGTAHIDTLDVDESGAIAADLTVGDDLSLVSDGSILGFGTNTEVTLTHVHDTGLLLNSTMALQFNDASQFIKGASNAILAIGATDEVDLTATLFDVNANLDVSGTALITGVLTATEAAVFNGGFTSNADTNTFTSANSTDPRIIIKNTTNDTNAAVLNFVKDKGAAGADDDSIGSIFFTGDNTAQEQILFARINGVVETAADGQEGGRIQLQVANHDAGMGTGFEVFDGDANNEIDVNIALGIFSLTTVAGNLFVANYTNSQSAPIGVAANSSHFNISLQENSGTESWQIGVDADGDLNFHNSGGSTPSIVFNDSGDVAIGSTTPESNTNFVALTIGPGASTGGGQLYVESSSVRAVFGADNNGSDPKAIIGTTTNHPIVFFQNNADVGRFDASENFTIKTGNLVIGANGKGIDFTANTNDGSDTSELLDDYEEGTFTPALTDNSGRAGTAAIQIGRYVRVGGLVHVQGRVSINGLASMNGNVILTGMPFSTLNATNAHASLNFGQALNLNITAGVSLCGIFSLNSVAAEVQKMSSTAGSTALTHTELSADGSMIFSGTYRAN